MSSAVVIFLGIFTVLSLAATAAKCRKHRSYILLKPLPMLMLIGFLSVYAYRQYQPGSSASLFRILILCGLLLGLTGDLFLLNAKKFFFQGLAAFLLGHIVYCAAFVIFSNSFSALSLAAAFPCLLFFVFFITRISAQTKKKFFPAIAAYFVVITVMAVSAFSFDAGRASVLPVYGIAAAVFCVSDAALAWGIFVKENTFLHALVLLTYYGAQMMITLQSARLVW